MSSICTATSLETAAIRPRASMIAHADLCNAEGQGGARDGEAMCKRVGLRTSALAMQNTNQPRPPIS